MNYYQEITLLPNADIGVYFLWQKLYQQIHLALVENKNGSNLSRIGVSFPEYNAAEYFLGTKLRLFAGDVQSLEQMNFEKWLNRLSDYVFWGRMESVPENKVGYACFRHVRLKGSREKLARRRAKRKGETLEQALAYFEDLEEQQSKLPYINVASQTNGQHFRMFIEKREMKQARSGYFSCYGLSSTTTVPLF